MGRIYRISIILIIVLELIFNRAIEHVKLSIDSKLLSLLYSASIFYLLLNPLIVALLFRLFKVKNAQQLNNMFKIIIPLNLAIAITHLILVSGR